MDELEKKFDVLTKRAKNCESMYTTLRSNYPGSVHEWNRSIAGVMRGYWRVKGWGEQISENTLEDWENSIKWHEKRLENLAKGLYPELTKG